MGMGVCRKLYRLVLEAGHRFFKFLASHRPMEKCRVRVALAYRL